ncbi:uncharacterized protein LOC123545048 isoform X3 [Mercenaria mercenaria]|uniref:uncharacterized protein LOC123545048 isoform X3 n=1 Tax=Mercenaria mercenaria TaxID=6596 RepID=UPI00234F1FBC|nr:uncharacterized protein LOC123545048 isoform X3 [Mercenaria mercenaria]
MNTTCEQHCVRHTLRTEEWCHEWKPPPTPPQAKISARQWEEVVLTLQESELYKKYANACNITIPQLPSTTTTISENSTVPHWANVSLPVSENSTVSLWTNSSLPFSDTTSTATNVPTIVTTVGPLLTTTTAAGTTKNMIFQEEAHTAGGTIAVIVVVIILLLIAVAVVLSWYLWKRKKMRTGSINSLPLKKYENTNYLDNRARDNHSWNPSSNHLASDSNSKGIDYGSLPQPGMTNDAQYMKKKSRNSSETRVESPREFDKMNASGLSEKLAFDNENFMTDRDQNGAVSPGATSQTPLFDMMDGAALPNVVPDCKTVSENSIHNGDKIHQNGSVGKIPEGKSPPVDMSVTMRKMSDSSTKSPKKKKPIYLRKSMPMPEMEDITQDMTGNRKSV